MVRAAPSVAPRIGLGGAKPRGIVVGLPRRRHLRGGRVAAVNLGDDADTTGAICGQLAQRCWVAAIDWQAIRHASDKPGANRKNTNGLSPS
jgi:hypothetical protein